MMPGETILSGAPILPGVSAFKVMRSGASVEPCLDFRRQVLVGRMHVAELRLA